MNRLNSWSQESFRNQIILSTSLMLIVPLLTFFSARSYLDSLFLTPAVLSKGFVHANNVAFQVDVYAGLAAIVAVWAVIVGVIVVKYTEDITAVFVEGKGDVPYEG